MNEKLSVSVIDTVDDGTLDALSEAERICFGKNAWSRAAFEAFIRNDFSFAVTAYSDGVLVGYAVASVIFGESELTNIAVLPEARRQGIASSIMASLIAHVRTLDAYALHLEVREGNLAARSLYESLGFAADGRRKGYYSSPREDAILMTLNL